MGVKVRGCLQAGSDSAHVSGMFTARAAPEGLVHIAPMPLHCPGKQGGPQQCTSWSYCCCHHRATSSSVPPAVADGTVAPGAAVTEPAAPAATVAAKPCASGPDQTAAGDIFYPSQSMGSPTASFMRQQVLNTPS